jgi:flagellar hook-basal body complex protein FliE
VKRIASPVGDVKAAAPSFGDLVAQSINDAVESGKSGENVSMQAISGRADLADVVEAVNAAEVSLQTVVSIRDRVLSAYQEILRMPI